MVQDNCFEIAVLAESRGMRPIFCFPESAARRAEMLADKLPAELTYYTDRYDIPLMITDGGKRWLAVRSLMATDGIMVVIDLGSPRARRLDIDDIPADILDLTERGCELLLYECERGPQSDEQWCLTPVSSLSTCATGGNIREAADCFCAMADIMGCGLELTAEYGEGQNDVDVGVAVTMALYMFMLCLRAGADRGCRMVIGYDDGQVTVSLDFELCPPDIRDDDSDEPREIAACRALAQTHNFPLELDVLQGRVRCRFSPACREWSYLGIKLPSGLEYD